MSQFCTIRIAPQPSSSDVVCLISKMAAVGGGGGRLIWRQAERSGAPVHLLDPLAACHCYYWKLRTTVDHEKLVSLFSGGNACCKLWNNSFYSAWRVEWSRIHTIFLKLEQNCETVVFYVTISKLQMRIFTSLFVCGLFNDAFIRPDYTTLNCRMISKWLEKGIEGSSSVLI